MKINYDKYTGHTEGTELEILEKMNSNKGWNRGNESWLAFRHRTEDERERLGKCLEARRVLKEDSPLILQRCMELEAGKVEMKKALEQIKDLTTDNITLIPMGSTINRIVVEALSRAEEGE